MEAAAAQLKPKLRVDLHPATIAMTDPALLDHPMVFMHGRNSFHLTDAERAALRTYVDRGGVVLADAICASRAFTESFRREMAATFPDHALERIPAERSAVYQNLRWLRPREGFPPRSAAGGDEQPRATASAASRLSWKGFASDDRYGVIFSQFDLSCALEKLDSLECRGYTREDAARIALNVLLYALH